MGQACLGRQWGRKARPYSKAEVPDGSAGKGLGEGVGAGVQRPRSWAEAVGQELQGANWLFMAN